MKKSRLYIGVLFALLIGCLLASCGKDDLDNKTVPPLEGTWGLLHVDVAVGRGDNRVIINGDFDPINNPDDFIIPVDSTQTYILQCMKFVIVKNTNESYTLKYYYYDTFENDWVYLQKGESPDGTLFTMDDGASFYKILSKSSKTLIVEYRNTYTEEFLSTFTRMN